MFNRFFAFSAGVGKAAPPDGLPCAEQNALRHLPPVCAERQHAVRAPRGHAAGQVELRCPASRAERGKRVVVRGGEVLPPRAERVERKAQHPRLQDRGCLRDRRAGQRHRAGLRFQLRQIGGSKGVEVFILLPQAQCRLADVLDRLRVDPAELRHRG